MMDEEGQPWVFNDPTQRKRAEQIVRTQKRALFMVCPMCNACSTLNRVTFKRMSESRRQDIMEYGRTHLEFALYFCKIQSQPGIYYRFEHPRYASSWQEACVVNLMDNTKAKTANADMCQLGMEIEDNEGMQQPVKKPTTFMSNSEQTLRRLERKCDDQHEHMSLYSGGNASKAQVYPGKLCKAILKGLNAQLEECGRMAERGMAAHPEESNIYCREILNLEVSSVHQGEYYDDMSGVTLDTEGVNKARAEAIAEVYKHNLCTKVPIKECWDKTGKGPNGTRWVDVNKGDNVNPAYRSRLVAQEVKTDKMDDLFAATPPLEANNMLMSLAVTEGIGYNGRMEAVMQLGSIDVRRAYFHARARRALFVKLPDEDDTEGMCGSLHKAMCGTRDAAQNWASEYVEFMSELDFPEAQLLPAYFPC